MATPTCKACGEQHFNFKPCKPRDEARENRSKLHVIYRPDSEFRPFGDRLENYENRGGNLHLLPRRTPDGKEAA